MKYVKTKLLVTSMLTIGLLLSGCSDKESESQPTPTEESQYVKADKSAKGVQTFFDFYYKDMAKQSKNSTSGFSELEQEYSTLILEQNQGDMEEMPDTMLFENTYKKLKKLDKNNLTKFANESSKANKLSKYYDFSNASDLEKAYTNTAILKNMSYLSSDADVSLVNVNIRPDIIDIEKGKNSTTLNVSEIEVTVKDDSYVFNTIEQSLGLEQVKLNYVDGKWKIDSEKVTKALKDSPYEK